MDIIRLRTLTEKSVLGFGKYSDCKVGDLLNVYKIKVLRWYYYNITGISFVDDVLAKIKINPEDKIDKPGIDPSKGIEVDKRILEKSDPLNKFIAKNRYKSTGKAIIHGFYRREEKKYSRMSLQRKNHGHKNN